MQAARGESARRHAAEKHRWRAGAGNRGAPWPFVAAGRQKLASRGELRVRVCACVAHPPVHMADEYASSAVARLAQTRWRRGPCRFQLAPALGLSRAATLGQSDRRLRAVHAQGL